ncbi:MAG: molybdopterin-dependent oxidoreductase [Actinomycetota bacterium]|nr:molybdopterin-dependent oxidoreductase [Actinomycetota bacterium]
MTLRELVRSRRRLPVQSDYPSILHSPRVAARVGLWLGITFTLCFITGLLSHLIQHPPSWFGWPTRPIWLYRLTQGVHISSGIASIPLLGIKLWVVTPRFWRRPLLTGLVNGLERLSILVLIASAAFELIGGLLNVAEFYPWTYFFPTVHFAVAWIVMGALLVHIAVKLPVIRNALSRPLSADDPPDPDDEREALDADTSTPLLVTAATAPKHQGSLSRRGLLGIAAGAVGIGTLATVGDRIPALQKISVLAQRSGAGPQGLPVNRSAQAAGVIKAANDPSWRLTVNGPTGTVQFSLADLQRLPQYSADLPIACVEGWARQANWTGVRLADLLSTVGAGPQASARLNSLDTGTYGHSDAAASVCRDPLTLVALKLNGQVLDDDHGYPARLIAPARPGELQTKWLNRIDVTA